MTEWRERISPKPNNTYHIWWIGRWDNSIHPSSFHLHYKIKQVQWTRETASKAGVMMINGGVTVLSSRAGGRLSWEKDYGDVLLWNYGVRGVGVEDGGGDGRDNKREEVFTDVRRMNETWRKKTRTRRNWMTWGFSSILYEMFEWIIAIQTNHYNIQH